jgi:hypothetical protein
MEQRSLVTRAECSEDLRAAYVVLTDTGWEAIKAAAPDHVRSVRDHLIDLLDADEIAALTSIGEKVAAHFGEGCLDRPVPQDDAVRPAYADQSANRSPVSSS